MTPEEFTRHLPAFANDMARVKPPFEFKNLSVRVFPLRANLDSLQQVCNGYLNVVPPEVGRFRAVVPYAFLMLLDYGQISEMDSSVGWFAQTEVYFGVAVEWYQVVNGKWVFRDWGVITPFIFVDDDFSVPLGRMVFGFPKTLARVTKAPSEWLKDPMAAVTLARVKTLVFPELYKGRPLESKVFLEVERDAPMSNFRIPADATSPIAPWVIASKVADAMAGFGRDVMSIAQSMRIFEPNPWADPTLGPEMLNRVMPAFAPGGTGSMLNSLNLKQFRSSSDPDKISYQALTNGRMQTTVFNGAGALGEERTALGDLTGGYTIKLHDYSSLPIARTLGLEVHRRCRGDGVDVLTLKPVMPFWANLNVKYLAGTNLAWRTRDGIWHGGNGEPLDPSQKPAARNPDADESDWPRFNTTVTSAADDATAGPFEFTGTTIRVLPLLANCQTLQTFLDRSINDAICDPRSKKHHKLTVWSRPDSEYAYVYMTASSFDSVTSKTNNVGDWAKYELSFLIPVKWEREVGHVDGVGLVPACSFVDGTIAAISRTEVLGIPTLRAEFVRPASVWLQEGEADFGARQTLLRVDAEVYTALHQGQQATTYPLIEISSRDFAGIGEPDSRANPPEWAEILRSELDSKRATKHASGLKCRIARALALELLGNPSLTAADQTDDRIPVSLYTLKQFRDVADPGKACYQSLVRVGRVFDEVHDVREIEETLRVRIHEFPSLKLVEQLGIVAKTVREEGAGIVYGTQAIRPFYIRATIHELPGERLLWRAGTLEWESDHKIDSWLSDEGAQQVRVDLQAERVQGDGDPSEMQWLVYQAIQRREDKTPTPSELDVIKRELGPRARKAALNRETLALRKAFARRELRLVKDKKLRMTRMEAREALLTDSERDRLRELRDSSKDGKREPGELKNLRRIKAFLEELNDWRSKQQMKKRAARDAVNVIDPQMVIESILSREWGSRDEKALWRRGVRDLRKARDTKLGAGSVPFAKFHLQERSTKDEIEVALGEGRRDFAAIERKLYSSVLTDQAKRLGWYMRTEYVEQMIDRMEEFTGCRLEMEYHFNIVAAWSIAPTILDSGRPTDWVNDELALKEVTDATQKLVSVLTDIKDRDVIGNPSKDDPHVLADWTRLEELVKQLDAKMSDLDREIRDGRSTKIEELLGGPTLGKVWLIDLIGEAVQLAGRYCEVQREALLNKLSKAYQKPDFCIRRDSVDPATRDRYFPISASWDEDWYCGGDATMSKP